MTTLPAMLEEPEALAYARHRIVTQRALLDPGVSLRVSRTVLKANAQSHPFRMDDLIAMAMAGWADARLALEELFDEAVAAGTLERWPQLAFYHINQRNRPHPQGVRGPNKGKHICRNLLICDIVEKLVELFGLRHVRRREAKTPARRLSACAVLAKAFEQEPGPPKFKLRQLEAIWENFGGLTSQWRNLLPSGEEADLTKFLEIAARARTKN